MPRFEWKQVARFWPPAPCLSHIGSRRISGVEIEVIQLREGDPQISRRSREEISRGRESSVYLPHLPPPTPRGTKRKQNWRVRLKVFPNSMTLLKRHVSQSFTELFYLAYSITSISTKRLKIPKMTRSSPETFPDIQSKIVSKAVKRFKNVRSLRVGSLNISDKPRWFNGICLK